MRMGQADVVAVLKEHGELTSKEVASHFPNIPIMTIRHNLVHAKRAGLVEMRKFDIKGGGGVYKYRLKGKQDGAN